MHPPCQKTELPPTYAAYGHLRFNKNTISWEFFLSSKYANMYIKFYFLINISIHVQVPYWVMMYNVDIQYLNILSESLGKFCWKYFDLCIWPTVNGKSFRFCYISEIDLCIIKFFHMAHVPDINNLKLYLINKTSAVLFKQGCINRKGHKQIVLLYLR